MESIIAAGVVSFISAASAVGSAWLTNYYAAKREETTLTRAKELAAQQFEEKQTIALQEKAEAAHEEQRELGKTISTLFLSQIRWLKETRDYSPGIYLEEFEKYWNTLQPPIDLRARISEVRDNTIRNRLETILDSIDDYEAISRYQDKTYYFNILNILTLGSLQAAALQRGQEPDSKFYKAYKELEEKIQIVAESREGF